MVCGHNPCGCSKPLNITPTRFFRVGVCCFMELFTLLQETQKMIILSIPYKGIHVIDSKTINFANSAIEFPCNKPPKFENNKLYFIVGAVNGSILLENIGLELKFIRQHSVTGNYNFMVVGVIKVINGKLGTFEKSDKSWTDFVNARNIIWKHGLNITMIDGDKLFVEKSKITRVNSSWCVAENFYDDRPKDVVFCDFDLLEKYPELDLL